MSKSEERITVNADDNTVDTSDSNGRADVELLTDLVAGKHPFCAWAKSKLRVVRNGKPTVLEVPIKSIGVVEVMEQLARNAPTPERKMSLIKKNSDEGRQMGLKHDQITYTADETDPDYIRRLREYDMQSTYRLVLHGLAINIKNERGDFLVKANDEHSATDVMDADRAVIVLKQSGLTSEHLQQLASDIRNLTAYEEARIDRE
jgi:hypothetical protein